MPAPRPVAPAAPPPAPALRPTPASVTGRSSLAANKPVVNGPVAPKPSVANGSHGEKGPLLITGGISSAPTRPVTNQATGRKVPPPAPSARPTGRTANKPPPPAAPPSKSAAGARPNLAANLADMVISTAR